jgi:hypothetical protein
VSWRTGGRCSTLPDAAARNGLLKLMAPAMVATALATPLILFFTICISIDAYDKTASAYGKSCPVGKEHHTWRVNEGLLGVTLVLEESGIPAY